jgi:two-component system response regulator HydG
MNRHKILVVDDEEKIREICRIALEYAGYRVGVAQNVQEALEFLEKEDDYALVLTDLNLPGLNGLELIKEIEKRHPHCKTLLMTGSLTVTHTYTKDCLHKPFGFVELVSKIKKVLSSP